MFRRVSIGLEQRGKREKNEASTTITTKQYEAPRTDIDLKH